MTQTETIPAGYKKTEVGIIPEGWEVKIIEDLTPKNKKNMIVDGPFGSNLKTIHYRKAGIPIITSGYVTSGKFFASTYLFVDVEKFIQEKRSAVKGGDIVMAKIGERCGASAILPKNHPEGILSGNALKITIDESRFSTLLISQILWRDHKFGYLEKLRIAGAQPAISMESLKKYKIIVPKSKSEQIAIANILSDTDALIESLKKLIAKKKAIKQGAMQQLLTGKKRLPGFSGEWEVVPFNEVMFKINAKKYQLQTLYYKDTGNFPVIDQGKSLIAGYSDRYDKVFQCPKEGVIIFGDHTCIIKYINFNFIVGADGTQILGVKSRYCAQFYALQLMCYGIQPTGYNRHFKYLKEKYFLSTCLEEQTAIAKILSDMDEEIEKLQQKRDKYISIKQGMMQQLLTGKIRLVKNGDN